MPRSFALCTINKVIDLVDKIQTVHADPLILYELLSRADLKSGNNRNVAQALASFVRSIAMTC